MNSADPARLREVEQLRDEFDKSAAQLGNALKDTPNDLSAVC